MSKPDEKERFSVADRDFSVRWHVTTVAVIVLSGAVLYFAASKLVLS